MKVGGVTSKGCGGTFAAQGAKCEKDGTQNVALGSLTCCSGKDYCNGDGAGGEGTPANTTTTTATVSLLTMWGGGIVWGEQFDRIEQFSELECTEPAYLPKSEPACSSLTLSSICSIH